MQGSALTALCFIPVLTLWVLAAVHFERSSTGAHVTRARAYGTSLALALCAAAQGTLGFVAASAELTLLCALAAACAHFAQLLLDSDRSGLFHHKRTRLPFCFGLVVLAAGLAQLPLVAHLVPTVFAGLIFTRFLVGQGRQSAKRQDELEAVQARLVSLTCELHNVALTEPILGETHATPASEHHPSEDHRKKA